MELPEMQKLMQTKITKTGVIVFSPFETRNVGEGTTINLTEAQYRAAFEQGYTEEKEFIDTPPKVESSNEEGESKKGLKEKIFGSKRPGKKGALNEENKDRTKA